MVATPTAMFAIAVPAALAAAIAQGAANATQAAATHQVPTARNLLDPRLVTQLLGRPAWLLGLAATVAALGLQVIALGFGPLLLVQPLLVCALPCTTVLAARLRHRRLDRTIVTEVGLCVAGLCAFLLIAHPTPGRVHLVAAARVFPLAAIFTVVLIACLIVAYRTRHAPRVVALALATGVLYGLTAALMKLIAAQLRTGLAAPFTSWVLWTAVLIGPLGFLLSQHTFQQGQWATPAVAIITTVDPLIGIGIGVSWFDETITTTPTALAGELLAGAILTLGITLLARRGQQLKTQVEEQYVHQ